MNGSVPLGEIGGNDPRLDPAFGDIKNGIEHSPHAQGARASPAFGGGNQLFDPLPFFVGQVAWIGFFIHISILHNPRRLFRQALRTASYSKRRTSRRPARAWPARPRWRPGTGTDRP